MKLTAVQMNSGASKQDNISQADDLDPLIGEILVVTGQGQSGTVQGAFLDFFPV